MATMAAISARRGVERRSGVCRCHPLIFIFSLVGLAIVIAASALLTVSKTNSITNETGPTFNLQRASASLGVEDTLKSPGGKALESDGVSAPGDNAHNAEHIKYQLTFSTDCGAYQRWQSYLMFYSAMVVNQPGYVTRIASGCTDEEAAEEQRWHDEHIKSKMSERFLLHLTPHFSKVKDENGKETGKNYDFFNKPYGMKHWMEHGEGMGVDENGKILNEDAICILIDPDQILLRPLTEDFSDPAHVFRADMGKRTVQHGHPFSQEYGYGADWKKHAVPISEKDSPARKLTNREAADYYPAGPPYMATGRDFYRIVKKWTEYVPLVHKIYPHLLAEMYAYSLAAAHVELPHQMVRTLMMSDTGNQREGWSLIDDLSTKEACEFGLNIRNADRALPGVMHYCQRYMIGKHFFGKRRLPKDFLTCEKSLLFEPPPDVGAHFNYKIPPPPHKPPGEKKPLNEMQQRREAFAVCLITRRLNDAATFWKQNACEEGKGNLNKVLDLWSVEEMHTSTGR